MSEKNLKEPWKNAMEPFRIRGGLYFVGTVPASTHVLDTGDGLILFDSGYQQSLYLVLHNMVRMGLDPMKIKYILHTHGHIDHFGATRALVEMTGAKTAIGREDAPVARGELDLSFAAEIGEEFTETFEPDILLTDGDTITLGNVTVTAMATPGHTAGAMSFFFDVEEDGEISRCGLHGGAGLNSLTREYLLNRHIGLEMRERFITSMERLERIPVDLFLGNHIKHNDTPGRAARLAAGDRRAFIDPGAWSAFARASKEALLLMMQKEKE